MSKAEPRKHVGRYCVAVVGIGKEKLCRSNFLFALKDLQDGGRILRSLVDKYAFRRRYTKTNTEVKSLKQIIDILNINEYI